MEQETLEDRILLIRRRDRRYCKEAYMFVLGLVDFALERVRSKPGSEQAHLSAASLLSFLGACAEEQFGRGASLVFQVWNVRLSDDFGEIVWNLIDHDLLSRGPDDARYEFQTQVPVGDLLLPPPKLIGPAPARCPDVTEGG